MTVRTLADAPGATFGFRPWLRRGIGATAGQPDGPGLPDRAALQVTLDVTAVSGGAVVTDAPAPQMTVHLYGPGDVIGIDPRHIIRTEPRDQTMNFEPNYLAGLEFDYPDFPWLFTPATPDGDRLRPFVALIVLEDGEYAAPDVPANPLPAIDVQSMAALQPLDDAWNWAHAQISGDGDPTSIIGSNPAAAISRVLCPRRLDPETGYTAFLVPAFEIGRQAGLGLDVSGLHTSDPAWTSRTAAPLRLPVYYQFSFRTSDAGDFESLVRRLTPTVLPPDVGSAPMDVSRPGAGIPGAGPPLGLEGALRSAATAPTPWSGPDHDAFQAEVATLVNLTAAAGPDDPDHPAPQDPHIVPPFYGKWQAAAAAVTPGQPGWLNDLNLDPRNRAAAGMGTQIVQAQRTALMAAAWAQVAGVEAANQQLRAAQLSRGGHVLDETDERFPIFRGALSPDITFFGFNLSADDARGGTAAAPLGFFFVFQEQPTEPRFGLEPQSAEPVTQWEDLAWTNFAVPGGQAASPGTGFGAGQGTLPQSAVSSVFPGFAPAEISRYRVASTVFAGVLASFSLPAFLSASASPSGVALSGANPEDSALAWGTNAAQTAAITIRMPFRIMVHADSLLPAAPVNPAAQHDLAPAGRA